MSYVLTWRREAGYFVPIPTFPLNVVYPDVPHLWSKSQRNHSLFHHEPGFEVENKGFRRKT